VNIAKRILGFVLGMSLTLGAAAADETAAAPVEADTASIYSLPVEPMKLDEHTSPTLAPYRGSVMLIVNVASKCGFTKQYTGLEKIHREYKDQGLVILGFPCNQFGGQEPGTEEEIVEFCKAKYDVTFPIYAKLEVKGEGQAPLYKELTAFQGAETGDVKWNFEKFLIGRDGKILERYRSKVAPEDPALNEAIKMALAQPAP
jgi:glutathione peroxidase